MSKQIKTKYYVSVNFAFISDSQDTCENQGELEKQALEELKKRLSKAGEPTGLSCEIYDSEADEEQHPSW